MTTDEAKIKWVNVDNLGIGLGHGVEFFHDECRKEKVSPIAFLDGYEWMRGKL